MEEIISEVIDSSYTVFRTLGKGFLENVYKRALCVELKGRGYCLELEKAVNVYYKNEIVGSYFADLYYSGLIVETKCVGSIILPHIFQVKNYLKATGINEGLIINFGGSRVDVKRIYG